MTSGMHNRTYLLAPAGAKIPADAPLVGEPAVLPDGTLRLKVSRYTVEHAKGASGELVRTIPKVVADIPGISAPMGSLAVARHEAKLDAEQLTIAAIKARAAEIGADIKASLKAAVVAEYVDAACGPAKVELAPPGVPPAKVAAAEAEVGK